MTNDSDPRATRASGAGQPRRRNPTLVYLIALVLVWGLSFYAGMLRPKKAEGLGPPPVSVPQQR